MRTFFIKFHVGYC